jgi:hypothetical protein
MTTASFANFVAEQDARNTIQLNILKYCFLLTDALLQNFIEYSISSHQRYLEKPHYDSDYRNARIQDLKNGNCDINYEVTSSGNKYHKIIMKYNDGQRSVHAFVDKKTGDVYKPASWKGPAKGVRYNLLLIKDREWLLENADWAGGYLYQK